jgi:hypothetical protein
MISGLRITMYAIVTNVTRPPRTSRLSDDPRSVKWKRRSRASAMVRRGRSVVEMIYSNGSGTGRRRTGAARPRQA